MPELPTSPAFDASLEQLCYIVVKARQYHVKEAAVLPEDASIRAMIAASRCLLMIRC